MDRATDGDGTVNVERQADERALVLLAAKLASGVGTPQDAALFTTLRGHFSADPE